MTLQGTFESKVNEALNSCITQAGKAAQNSLDYLNNVRAMVMAGSKGSSLNISQMMACVGQQNVEGKRIKFSFRDRTLPHFKKFNLGPSLVVLLATHTCAARHRKSSSIPWVVEKVSSTRLAKLQRLIHSATPGKVNEDIGIRYDGTVRNQLDHVIQFLRGGRYGRLARRGSEG